MTCPDIDLLLSATAREASRTHLETCSACAAVASLAVVREERLEGHEDACMHAEVSIALWHTGEIDEKRRAELMAHLEACSACNDAAVRVHAMPQLGEEATGEHAIPARATVRRETRRGVRIGALAALGAAAAMSVGAVAAWQLGQDDTTPKAERLPSVPVPAERAAARAPAGGATTTDDTAPEPTVDPLILPPAPIPAASKGYVTLMCIPSCEVREDGRRIGSSPIVRHETNPGQHRYELEHGGHTKTLVLDVAPGQTSARRVVMPEALVNPFDDAPADTKLGFLTVMCVPGCDGVYVDGKLAGRSPIVRKALAPGLHVLRYQRGSISKMQQLRIVAGQTTARRVNMEQTAVPPAKQPPADEVLDPWR